MDSECSISYYGSWDRLTFNILFNLLLTFLINIYLIAIMLAYCSKPLPSSPISDKCNVRLTEEAHRKIFSEWFLHYYVIGCAFGLSMVRGYKVFTLWPMASPWNNLDGSYELALVWTHLSRFLLITYFDMLVLDNFFLLWYALFDLAIQLLLYFCLEEGKLTGCLYIHHMCSTCLLSFVNCSNIYHINLHAFFFWNMSCKLEVTFASSPMVIV